MNRLKLCKDCKHYYSIINVALCKRNNKISLVTGEECWDRDLYCAEERNTFPLFGCGKKGKYWEKL